MKAVLLILVSLLLVNCSDKKFSATTAKASDDNVVQDDTPNDPPDDDDDDDENDCPRYELVVKSTHTSNKKLNFAYTFNAEMTHTTVEGAHKIVFNKAQYSPCSGNYSNNSILTSMIPLQSTEDLTAEVLLTHGGVCASSARTTTIQVLDVATNTLVFDEAAMRDEHGCEFGYTTDGEALRALILNLADGVANAKGAACN